MGGGPYDYIYFILLCILKKLLAYLEKGFLMSLVKHGTEI